MLQRGVAVCVEVAQSQAVLDCAANRGLHEGGQRLAFGQHGLDSRA